MQSQPHRMGTLAQGTTSTPQCPSKTNECTLHMPHFYNQVPPSSSGAETPQNRALLPANNELQQQQGVVLNSKQHKAKNPAAMASPTGLSGFQLYTLLCQARNEIWASKHLLPTRAKVIIKKIQSRLTHIYCGEGFRDLVGNFSHNRHAVVIPRYTSK